MHPNGVLLQRLFTALNQHDHRAMASCYQPEATFHDIAFDLPKMQSIPAMWHMICEGTDIKATFEVIEANDFAGRVRLVDVYTFKKNAVTAGRPVRNVIDCRFRFRDGLIIEHSNSCDPRAWAAMAMGGAEGFLAGQFRFLRRLGAKKKLEGFVQLHPEYARAV